MFQPQVDLRSGLIVGAESHLRWRDASLGAVPVEKAIAAAESAGLVNEVTLWLVNGALRNCREFRDAAGGTEMLDVVDYELPLGPLGELAHSLAVRRTLARIFHFRSQAIAAAFPSPPGG